MEQGVSWVRIALQVAGIGAGLAGIGVALQSSTATTWHSGGMWLLGTGGALVSLGLLTSLSLATTPLVRAFYFRKPRLSRGWEVERKGPRIEDGDYLLSIRLTRPQSKRPLAAGELVVRCNRAVLKASFRRTEKARHGESQRNAFPSIDHRGVVTLKVPEIDAGDRFYFDGDLQSDGPLKIHRVQYRES